MKAPHGIEQVVGRGMCIGCGACSAATGGAIRLSLGPTRLYQADLTGADDSDRHLGDRVCPFSDLSPNEDELGAPHPAAGAVPDAFLGAHISTYAGRVNSSDYLKGSSSGGLTSWTVSQMLETGLADAVISVGTTAPSDPELFGYGTQDASQYPKSRKSMYYATSMAEVLETVRSHDLQFVLIGVPCFIRAARALALLDNVFEKRLAFFVALVCGHYKTQAFAESLAWQVGVDPEQLAEVDFRLKAEGRSASDYSFGARAKGDSHWRERPTRTLVGANWGHNTFQPEACNFCDDVVGETADVSFGDAWLPEYVSDPNGTNVVVVRSENINSLLLAGRQNGEITLDKVSAADVVTSQAGGFRHRREGLSVRLSDDVSAGLSVPKKRVDPSSADAVPPRRQELYRRRRRMAWLSQEAFAHARQTGDLNAYLRVMNREIRAYTRLAQSWHRRAELWVKRIMRRALMRTGILNERG